MLGSTTVRWLGAVWLLLISIGLFAILILIPLGIWLPEVASESGKLLLKRFNTISHLFPPASHYNLLIPASQNTD